MVSHLWGHRINWGDAFSVLGLCMASAGLLRRVRRHSTTTQGGGKSSGGGALEPRRPLHERGEGIADVKAGKPRSRAWRRFSRSARLLPRIRSRRAPGPLGGRTAETLDSGDNSVEDPPVFRRSHRRTCGCEGVVGRRVGAGGRFTRCGGANRRGSQSKRCGYSVMVVSGRARRGGAGQGWRADRRSSAELISRAFARGAEAVFSGWPPASSAHSSRGAELSFQGPPTSCTPRWAG